LKISFVKKKIYSIALTNMSHTINIIRYIATVLIKYLNIVAIV